MAFDKANFKNGGNATAAPSIHTYKTTDDAATVNTAGYFNDVADEVRVGDLVYVYGDTDGTPFYQLMPINANDGTTVDVTDGTAISTTDTD